MQGVSGQKKAKIWWTKFVNDPKQQKYKRARFIGVFIVLGI